MPYTSSPPATEKKNKSRNKAKKSKRGSDSLQSIGEPAKSRGSKKSRRKQESPVKEESDSISEDNESQDDSDDEETGDTDALTTMNAIMVYNRKLMQRLNQLEIQAQEQGDEVSKKAVHDTVQDAYNEIKDKYDRNEKALGTNHSFELPIGNMMKGYGNFNTAPMPEDEKDGPKKTVEKDEETSTVQDDGNEGNKISIVNGEKDDIVVKVEATKTGITFSIHIPRN